MKNYEPQKIEKKWQKKWQRARVFKAKDKSKNPKQYLLIEFPYPSGEGLHVGHCRSYTAMDIIARKRRMQGFNVLYPVGWDAFGLPTENFAIKKGIHPAVATKNNTNNFRKQIKSLGISFDWDREINTTDPKYYKWTQWIFIQLFKNGLAYKDKIAINWCPSCKTGLANEEVVSGNCERCGTKTEKRDKEQWMIKITKYADRLIKDLDSVDYLEKIKVQQKEWIGKSDGALVEFPLEGSNDFIEIFTTRIDTIFSGTFLILAPGNKLISKYKDKIENWDEVFKYCEMAKNAPDIERTSEAREITGVGLKGISAVNPATGEKMPVWIADFVLEHYGTGAVFADSHDSRDFKMAKKYNLPLKTSIIPPDSSIIEKIKNLEQCFEGEGVLCNSGQFDGLKSGEARPKIISWLKQKGLAKEKTSYKLRDWVFSRQHYWGEPIPMVYCAKCGWQPAREEDLPIKLPKVKQYKPTDTGESPLANIGKWVNVKCPKCKGFAKRETDTMPNWAGSNWYYLRYTDPKNNKKLADEKLLKYWMPVDWYNGGMEHTTLHLLYSRFIFKFLWDIGAVPKEAGSEPYKKRTSHGMILGEGGIKMSKSKGNVINPDDIVKEFGADTLRVYEMFMGPFDQMIPWDEKGIVGAKRFLDKIYNLASRKSEESEELKKLLHKTIKKVSEDIEEMKFNTAISAMMEFVNECFARRSLGEGEAGLDKESLKKFLAILSPFAPHIAEELWKGKGFCCNSKWPQYDKEIIKEETINLVVQINGKVRDTMPVPVGITEDEAKEMALKSEKIKKWLEGKKIKKIIFVPKKLVNFVAIDKIK